MIHILLLLALLAPAAFCQTVTLGEALQPPSSTVPAGADDANVFHLTLTRDDVTPLLPIFFTSLQLTQSGTAVFGDYTELKLYAFSLGRTGVTQTLIATSTTFSFSGFSRLLIPDVPEVLLVTAAIPLTSQDGNTFEFSLDNTQLGLSAGSRSGGPIQGGTHTISNTGFTPMISVRDAAGSAISSGVSSTYDLQTVQGDTALAGQSYTFTIHNPGTGTLELPGTPAVLAGPINNCTVNVVQPAVIAIAAGGSASFTLEIEPTAVGAFSLAVTIFNNSGTNPYLFSINGNATVQIATQLAITTQPGGGRKGSALSPQPVVEARDATGAVDSAFNGLVVSTVNGGAGLVGTSAVRAVNGVAIFNNVGVNQSGSYQMTFTSGNLTAAVSSTFEVSGGGGGGSGGSDGGCASRPVNSGTLLLFALPVIVLLSRRLRAAG